MRLRRDTLTVCTTSAVVIAGCDPVLNIAGANFPAWLVCALAGAFGTALVRPVLVAMGIEPYVWPAALVYLSLAIVIACVVYLICFNRI